MFFVSNRIDSEKKMTSVSRRRYWLERAWFGQDPSLLSSKKVMVLSTPPLVETFQSYRLQS